MSVTQYAYYPGCSGMGSSIEYDISTRALCKSLGVELLDIPDWNCCGSTPAHASDHLLSASLVARNLAIAESMDVAGIITPCPSCLKNLKTTSLRMQRKAFHDKVESIVERPVRADLPIKSVLQTVLEHCEPEAIASHVSRPLKGLKVVPYYGCIMNRPPDVMTFDDPENPTSLDRLMTALGAEVLPFPHKVDCCGASLGLVRRDLVTTLSGRILDTAAALGAHAIVAACPMCQMNLDMRQSQINRANHTRHHMPVFYYTQLAGLALGQSESCLCMDKLCVNPADTLRLVDCPAAEERTR